MIKRIITLLILLLPLLTIASFGNSRVFAADPVDPFKTVCSDPQAGGSSVCPNGSSGLTGGNADPAADPLTGPTGIIMKAIRLLASVAGIASVIIIIIAGLKYVNANGDSNSINNAKNTIIYAIVGLLVSLMAQGIIAIVINRIN